MTSRLCAILIVLLVLANPLRMLSQDIHFSQFFQSPVLLNPALCGQFDGSYRFGLNQRTQWRSVTTPYSTFALSADANNITLPDGILNSEDGNFKELPYHGGVSFYSDKAGDSQLKTTGFNVAGAKTFKVPFDNKATIAAGAMIGVTSMRIDYSNLTYDSQWNGVNYDPNLPPGEVFPRAGRGYLNLNLGGLYMRPIDEKRSFTAGLSLFNLSRPKQSFFDEGYVKLDARVNVHGSYRQIIDDQITIEPMALIMRQGKYTEFNIGGLAHYTLSQKPWTRNGLYAGLFVRAKDSGFFIAGMQYDVWNVGISYDVNTSRLRPASNGRGGLEFSVLYTMSKFPKKNNAKTCPNYM
ncbi:MAG: PorP/SprF family type IX secretion system membrane protein [Flavobacteriales bacterium]|jgi:type IX secretion system PorP/SprF family membrane protein